MNYSVNIKYPALIIDIDKLESNTRFFVDSCSKYNIEIAAVTKCYCAIPELAYAQIRGGAKILADSRISNLKKIAELPASKMLIRIPMLSEVGDVVRYADISLNSEIEVIKALSEEAVKKKKKHKVVLMIEMGDLREGCLPEDAVSLAGEIIRQDGLIFEGIGANFSCISGILPDKENLSRLTDIADRIYEHYKVWGNMISGGNSCSYPLMRSGQMPERINNLRIGGIILHGFDAQAGKPIEGVFPDVFILKAEIVEIKDKPSKPFGTAGLDAFGNAPVFEDHGVRKRALLAVGRQDLRIEAVYPKVFGAVIVGASSDHMVVDVTDCKQDYKVGDVLEFGLYYGGILSACTSDYVKKIIK